jgi:1-deoxy-D-xylulose-5-phosphate synthase
MMFTATHQKHPVFIRYPRGPAEGVALKESPRLLEIGRAEVVRNFANTSGRKVALFGLGNLQSLARQTAEQLAAEGFDTALVNPRFAKPLDAGVHEFFGRAADIVLTFEDHALAGGYGSSVMELFAEKGLTTPVARIGWPDQFIEHATSVDDLRRKYGLTVENAIAQAKAAFKTPAAARMSVVA